MRIGAARWRWRRQESQAGTGAWRARLICWLWMLRGGCAYHELSVCSAGGGCCGAGVLIMGRYDERRGFLTDGSNYTYDFPRVGSNKPCRQSPAPSLAPPTEPQTASPAPAVNLAKVPSHHHPEQHLKQHPHHTTCTSTPSCMPPCTRPSRCKHAPAPSPAFAIAPGRQHRNPHRHQHLKRLPTNSIPQHHQHQHPKLHSPCTLPSRCKNAHAPSNTTCTITPNYMIPGVQNTVDR